MWSRIFWIINIFVVENIFRKLSYFIKLISATFEGRKGFPANNYPMQSLSIPLRNDRLLKKVSRMRGIIRKQYKSLTFWIYQKIEYQPLISILQAYYTLRISLPTLGIGGSVLASSPLPPSWIVSTVEHFDSPI